MGKPECICRSFSAVSSSGRVCEDRKCGRMVWAEVKVVGTADIIAGFWPINLLLGPHRGKADSHRRLVLELVPRVARCQVPGQGATAKMVGGRRAVGFPRRLGCSLDCLALHVQHSGIRCLLSVVLCGEEMDCVRNDRTRKDKTRPQSQRWRT